MTTDTPGEPGAGETEPGTETETETETQTETEHEGAETDAAAFGDEGAGPA